MSIRERIEKIKTAVVKELEELAAEAEKVFPAVEAGAAVVAHAIPGAGAAAAIVEKIAEGAAAVIGCCGCRLAAHGQGGCTGCGKCTRTYAGARTAGAV